MFKKDDVINDLKKNVVDIKFTKRDGSTRSMKATLREDIIPQATKADPLSQKKIRRLPSPKEEKKWENY